MFIDDDACNIKLQIVCTNNNKHNDHKYALQLEKMGRLQWSLCIQCYGNI